MAALCYIQICSAAWDTIAQIKWAIVPVLFKTNRKFCFEIIAHCRWPEVVLKLCLKNFLSGCGSRLQSIWNAVRITKSDATLDRDKAATLICATKWKVKICSFTFRRSQSRASAIIEFWKLFNLSSANGLLTNPNNEHKQWKYFFDLCSVSCCLWNSDF